MACFIGSPSHSSERTVRCSEPFRSRSERHRELPKSLNFSQGELIAVLQAWLACPVLNFRCGPPVGMSFTAEHDQEQEDPQGDADPSDHIRQRRVAAIPGMNEDVLSEVLAVEREIGARLEAERKAARLWLERTRGELEQAKLSELTALRASAAREEEAAKTAAHDKAAAILQQEGAEAERVRRLEDEQLIPIVRQHVQLIARGHAG